MYVGTKSIEARPMALGVFSLLRKQTTPKGKDPRAMGYLLEYEDGYISWSPKHQFDGAYQTTGHFSFGHALWLLNRNYSVDRSGWNGRNMYIFLVPSDGNWQSYIAMMTAQKTNIPWLASQTDLLAKDWGIVIP